MSKTTSADQAVNDAKLTDRLAELILGWKPTRDRFLKPDRGWCPRRRLRPFDDVTHALQLLERVADRFSLRGDRGVFNTEVQIGGRCGKASGKQIARTVATALCRALGLQV